MRIENAPPPPTLLLLLPLLLQRDVIIIRIRTTTHTYTRFRDAPRAVSTFPRLQLSRAARLCGAVKFSQLRADASYSYNEV
ncbi:unnamed protein product [Trichogramma brassicae]|uniref:Uncharacterized protein n=1 Tax=Trichogramma brassicae TaxID=86971 RepID=A0A6H5I7Q0_9HYME|nr:unnamed protein product [Trichogramma brassicae]